ncbi:MAG: pentapeptide repeat-containing protein [Granulosicoccus sp.]
MDFSNISNRTLISETTLISNNRETDASTTTQPAPVPKSAELAKTRSITPTPNLERFVGLYMQYGDTAGPDGPNGVIDRGESESINAWVDSLIAADPGNQDLKEAKLVTQFVVDRFTDISALSGDKNVLTVDDLDAAFGPQPGLTGQRLTGQSFENIPLPNIDLRSADLRFTNFQGTDLSGANLEGANTTGAYFNNAVYDANTVFPANFHPANEGMIEKGASSVTITNPGVYDGTELGERAHIVIEPTEAAPNPEIVINGHGGADTIRRTTIGASVNINAGAGDDHVMIDVNRSLKNHSVVDGGDGHDILHYDVYLQEGETIEDVRPAVVQFENGSAAITTGEDTLLVQNVEDIRIRYWS